MSDFQQDIQNFQRYGVYIYKFDEVGNLIFNNLETISPIFIDNSNAFLFVNNSFVLLSIILALKNAESVLCTINLPIPAAK